MKAIAVYPGKSGSVHLEEVPKPELAAIPGGRGVVLQILRVGVDGTDKEINEAEYGVAPPGSEYLILGHESFGRVVEAGPNAGADLQPGTYAVAMVRRPGNSIYDQIGRQDMTTDDVYYERGISRLHGFLTEFVVDGAEYIVPLPESLHETGVLLEPLSISEKALDQAFSIQRRLGVWRPTRAAVLGAGPIGLLACLAARLRGLDLTCYSKGRPPMLRSKLVEAIGGRYASAQETTLAEEASRHGAFDIIIEATGYSPLAFEAAEVVAKNGVLILTSVTGGDRKAEINTDKVNQGFVLGNKVMVGSVNASRGDFERGVGDLIKAEAIYPGWLKRLLTTPIKGLDNYEAMMKTLEEDKDAIKVFVEIAS